MSSLLMLDGQSNHSFKRSAEVYLNYATAEVAKHETFINSFQPSELAEYKID